MNEYDIVYSIICHLNKDYIINLINNINKFNENNNYLICFHLNNSNYKYVNILKSKKVIINDTYYDKKTGTHLQCKPHLDNFFFLEKLGIKYNNFIISEDKIFGEF